MDRSVSAAPAAGEAARVVLTVVVSVVSFALAVAFALAVTFAERRAVDGDRAVGGGERDAEHSVTSPRCIEVEDERNERGVAFLAMASAPLWDFPG